MAYVNGLKHNLISVSQPCDNGLDVKFNRKFCALLKEDTTKEMMRADKRGDFYLLNFTTSNKEEKICLVESTSEVAWLWHNRFCHLNFHSLEKLVKLNLGSGLPSIKFEKDHLWSACEVVKLKRAAHKTKSHMSYIKPL